MIVYVVEEEYENYCSYYEKEIVGVYESKDKAQAKAKEKGEINKYRVYDITAYDTESGEVVNAEYILE